MSTPKELADKAKQMFDAFANGGAVPGRTQGQLHATIDQLQAMAEARQGSGEPVADGDYYSEEADDIAKSHARAALNVVPPSAQQATGPGQVLPTPFDTVSKVSPEGTDYEVPVFSAEQMHAFRAEVAAPATGKREPMTEVWVRCRVCGTPDTLERARHENQGGPAWPAHGITGEQR